jgi:sugar phosphate isomerase/epimerase
MRSTAVNGGIKANIHDLPPVEFDQVLRQMEQAGVGAWCFGSTIMNWAKKWSDPFENTKAEVLRAIPRMQRLGCFRVRIMSFKPDPEEYRIPREVIGRVREVVAMFQDAGMEPLHENCMNYGGMSWQHALELLDKCPGLGWVFDTANPLANEDRSKAKPWPRQDPWEFWQHLRPHVKHIHIKDAVVRDDGTLRYVWPGDGEGRVADIVQDAARHGYNGALSIEPHMVAVFHDPATGAPETGLDVKLRKNFIDYARALEGILRG